MKGRLNLMVALLFNVAAIKALTMITVTGVWLLFVTRVPFINLGGFSDYVMYGLYGTAAFAALVLFMGAKPKLLKGLFTLVLLILTGIYGYETYEVVTLGLSLGGSIDVLEVSFLALGTVLSFYLLVKVRTAKVKEKK